MLLFQLKIDEIVQKATVVKFPRVYTIKPKQYVIFPRNLKHQNVILYFKIVLLICDQTELCKFLIMKIFWVLNICICTRPIKLSKFLLGACIFSDCWDQFSRPYTELMTVPNLTFTELREVSMEHLRRVWHASRERLPFRTPGSVPDFGTC